MFRKIIDADSDKHRKLLSVTWRQNTELLHVAGDADSNFCTLNG
jgi:hypothetical protein